MDVFLNRGGKPGYVGLIDDKIPPFDIVLVSLVFDTINPSSEPSLLQMHLMRAMSKGNMGSYILGSVEYWKSQLELPALFERSTDLWIVKGELQSSCSRSISDQILTSENGVWNSKTAFKIKSTQEMGNLVYDMQMSQ